jgi:hypothetical protein
MELNISERFTNYINQFFNGIERQISSEIRSLEAQVEINKTNLRTLMIIIHKEYKKGNISEETYKTACLVYSMGDSETFTMDNENKS